MDIVMLEAVHLLREIIVDISAWRVPVVMYQ
jgi:hypothetical protein